MNAYLLAYIIQRFGVQEAEEERLWLLLMNTPNTVRWYNQLHDQWYRALERKARTMDQLLARGGVKLLVDLADAAVQKKFGFNYTI